MVKVFTESVFSSKGLTGETSALKLAYAAVGLLVLVLH